MSEPKESENVYRVEQEGLLALDKILMGLCIAGVAWIVSVLSAARLSGELLLCAKTALILDAVAFACFAWHAFRWPVRLKTLEIRTMEGYKALSDELCHILETIALPRAENAVFGKQGEKIIHGPDGKEYVSGPMEEIHKTALKAMLEAMNSESAIVRNSIQVHSAKINELERQALYGRLKERNARLKHFIDVAARRSRYILFVAFVAAALLVAVGL